MGNLDDKTLVLRCLAKDGRAWSQFVERYAPLVFWAIKKRLKHITGHYNQQDLEDIFQNVFILLWEKGKLGQIRNRDNISSWLAMVSANCAHNYFRNKREELLEEGSLQEVEGLPDCSAIAGFEQKKLNSILEQIFSLLSPREQIILKLSYLYDKTHEEIAKILKMPQSSVSSTIKRIKERLKERLEKQGWENF